MDNKAVNGIIDTLFKPKNMDKQNKILEAIQQASKEAAKHTHVSDKVKSLQQGTPQERTDTDKQNKSAEESTVEFIKRRFVTADSVIVFDEQFEGYLESKFNKLTTLQQANEELQKEVEYYERIIDAGQSIDWTMIANAEKLEKHNAELAKENNRLTELLKGQAYSIRKGCNSNLPFEQWNEKFLTGNGLIQSHESNKQP